MSSVDVVVPCYNYARYLDCCVRSVLTQPDVDVRVLIIDDASSDETPEVGKQIAVRDPRVTFWRNAANRGNINTYNEGLAWVSGDYFLLLSADDYLLPGALARAARVMDEHPEVVLTCGRAAVEKNGQMQPPLESQSSSSHYRLWTGQAFIERTCSDAATSPLWTPTAIVRTSAQKQAGKYSASLPHAGDLEMWLRFACLGSVAILDAWQAVYREHHSNMHSSYSKVANLRQHLLAFQTAFRQNGDKIADRELLEQKYRRALALAALQLTQAAINHNDQPAREAGLAFAVEVLPEIRASRAWWKVRLSQALGSRLTNLLRSTTTGLRTGSRR